MKLLIASAIDTNPYVNTLVNEIKRTDNSITMDKGADIFWSETATQYDIIHIMWPEELIYAQDWRTQTKTIQSLSDRLSFLRNNNVKIRTYDLVVSTRYYFAIFLSKSNK